MILCIETSTANCSVAIAKRNLPAEIKESILRNTHSENLTNYIEELIGRSGSRIGLLEGVVVNKGPGSYTGLRIGVSTAKGICHALDIPLMSFTVTETMVRGVLKKIIINQIEVTERTLLCPMIDARRMEVYHAIYDINGNEIKPTSAAVIDVYSFADFLSENEVIFFGDGSEKVKTIITDKNARFLDNIYPSAGDIADICYEKFDKKQFEDLAYFEPFYLKNFIAKKPSVKGLY